MHINNTIKIHRNNKKSQEHIGQVISLYLQLRESSLQSILIRNLHRTQIPSHQIQPGISLLIAAPFKFQQHIRLQLYEDFLLQQHQRRCIRSPLLDPLEVEK